MYLSSLNVSLKLFLHMIIHFVSCSAAKAPFLARFRVRRCGISELEQLAMNVSKHGSLQPSADKQSMGAELWQAAIFKVSYVACG